MIDEDPMARIRGDEILRFLRRLQPEIPTPCRGWPC
jgi:hypothetical protein